MTALRNDSVWQRLVAHSERLQGRRIEALFDADPARFERYSHRAGGVLLDYSKNLLDDAAREDLLALAESRDVAGWRERLFAGEHINNTEDRAVLHVALRQPGVSRPVDGYDAGEAVARELERMTAFAEAVRSGEATGISGRAFTDVVSIGIGGSDLGPRLIADVLAPWAAGGPRLHFVSNADGAEVATVLRGLDPETTLFVVASKSGGTRETLLNAETAIAWFGNGADRAEVLARHFAGVSASQDKLADLGIAAERRFRLWDWVGGRYSLWSAVSLPVMMHLGPSIFREFLAGGADMDRHFREAPAEENLPVLLALLNVWNTTAMGAASQAILPYDWRLRRLPDYLQQAEMESNGKRVTREGEPVSTHTGVVLWGRSGIDGQHAFYQFLHQGTQVVPADLICAVADEDDLPEHRRELLANCLAQSRAMMLGVDEETVRAELAADGISGDRLDLLAAHRVHEGNRPTNTLLLDRLDATGLGRLVALYEHRIFVEGVIWGINSFDQWGVQLGKTLAGELRGALQPGADAGTFDGSTTGLLGVIRGGG
ncbi:glucose-6-phosphate isomerase [Arhodomonas sp. AD133]|uniref:glucose-6-phosphate isomerase n=1 Tax=Arhodomonas sp. AD133 TaxID=3415009 RepID=UPI003EC0E4CA